MIHIEKDVKVALASAMADCTSNTVNYMSENKKVWKHFLDIVYSLLKRLILFGNYRLLFFSRNPESKSPRRDDCRLTEHRSLFEHTVKSELGNYCDCG